jgi:uncharacterized protein YhbP (UPF0306 family)
VNDLEQVTAFLASQSTLTLATVSDDGNPHATPLFYLLSGGFELYWLSSASSLHSLNLARNREASAAVYCATECWEQIRGVQMQGAAQLVNEPLERESVLVQYIRRFHLGVSFQSVIQESCLYKFIPCQVTCVDNSKGFGYKYDIFLPRIDSKTAT